MFELETTGIITSDKAFGNNNHILVIYVKRFQDNFPQTIDPRINVPLKIASWTIPTQDNCSLDNSPRQFPPTTIVLPRKITPGQLLPRAMTITNYNFFMAIFWFFSMAQIYNFRYDNKNNNDNGNKAWSLKLLSFIIL